MSTHPLNNIKLGLSLTGFRKLKCLEVSCALLLTQVRVKGKFLNSFLSTGIVPELRLVTLRASANILGPFPIEAAFCSTVNFNRLSRLSKGCCVLELGRIFPANEVFPDPSFLCLLPAEPLFSFADSGFGLLSTR